MGRLIDCDTVYMDGPNSLIISFSLFACMGYYRRIYHHYFMCVCVCVKINIYELAMSIMSIVTVVVMQTNVSVYCIASSSTMAYNEH